VKILIPLALAAVLAACATAPAPAPADPAASVAAAPDTVRDWPGFRGNLHRDGNVFIAGQPSADALRQLPARGVGCVVNLRTPDEMDDRERVPFDEAALLDSLGVAYVRIPLGGRDHPYTPAAVDSLAVALDRHRGPVLLHCTAAWRASHLWAAYLVAYRGWDVGDAYRRCEPLGIGTLPLARLLDRPLKVVADPDR
jgi:uncharacterized protein (TIGR01244 family)